MTNDTDELPRGWVKSNLDGITTAVSTNGKKVKTKDVQSTGEFPVIDQGAAECAGYLDDDTLVIHASLDHPIVLFGDHTRIVKYIQRDFIPGADGTKLLQTKSGIQPKYLHYLINATEVPDRGYGRHFHHLKKIELPVAPAAEQKRIADKLDTVLTRVDAVNTRLARVAPILKRFRQSVLSAATSGRLTEDWRIAQVDLGDADELMTKLTMDHDDIGGHERGNASEPTKEAHDLSPDQLPDSWRIGTLKDCCTPGRPICYGILKPGPELEEGIPYIRVADFPGNRLTLEGIKRTSPEIDLKFKRARLKAGDLLLSIRGSVGRLIEIPASLEGANITQDTARLSISQRLNSKYIYFALLAPETQRRMRNAIRGVAVRGINIGDVRALQVPIPNLAEQYEIVRRVETLFAVADRLEARLQTAQTAAKRLTPALLAKAFRGELVPQDPNDEPASELLRRLQQEAPSTSTKRGRKSAA